MLVNRNGQKILWLLLEYRFVRSAVVTQELAIGCSLGSVSILGFASDGQM